MQRITDMEAGELEAKTKDGQVTVLTVQDIMALLPHRYPMLMLDRMEEMEGEERAVGIKNVTHAEPWFQGHFPNYPVMPGVFLIEAMAQTAAALVAHHRGFLAEESVVYFMGVDKARFRAPVLPGDQLRIEVLRLKTRASVWRYRGIARVRGQVVAEAEYMAMHHRKAEPESQP